MNKLSTIFLIFISVAIFAACDADQSTAPPQKEGASLAITPENKRPVVVCDSKTFTAKSTNCRRLVWSLDGKIVGKGPKFTYNVVEESIDSSRLYRHLSFIHRLTVSEACRSKQQQEWIVIDGGRQCRNTDTVTDTATDVVTDPETDVVTDPATDVVTDPATDVVTDPETDVVTDPATDVVTEPETDVVTDPATDVVTEPETDVVTDPATDVVTDPATDVVTDPATDVVTDPATDVVTDPATDVVTDPATDVVTDPATDVVTDPATDVVTDPATDVVTDPATDVVTDPATDVVTDPATDVVTDPTTDVVTDTATDVVTDTETDAGIESQIAHLVGQYDWVGFTMDLDGMIISEKNRLIIQSFEGLLTITTDGAVNVDWMVNETDQAPFSFQILEVKDDAIKFYSAGDNCTDWVNYTMDGGNLTLDYPKGTCGAEDISVLLKLTRKP